MRGHADYPFSGGDQCLLEALRDRPAVLARPHPILIQSIEGFLLLLCLVGEEHHRGTAGAPSVSSGAGISSEHRRAWLPRPSESVASILDGQQRLPLAQANARGLMVTTPSSWSASMMRLPVRRTHP